MSALLCWQCGADVDDLPRPLSRQATCPKCFHELHCCRQCKHYDPDQSMRCLEDRAEPPLAKDNANFCDFFKPSHSAFSGGGGRQQHARDQLDALFGADSADDSSDDTPAAEDDPRKALDDLFKS